MIFDTNRPASVSVSRTDPDDLLSACSGHGFRLDDTDWPSAEHYYQAMKFEDPALRRIIREAPDAAAAGQLARRHRRRVRRDWKKLRRVMMTRALWSKCQANPEVADALLATADRHLLETSQYDYYWGCGRDLRGENTYGQILMAIRERLRAMPPGT